MSSNNNNNNNDNNNDGLLGRRKARFDLLDDVDVTQHSLIADIPSTRESLHMIRPTDEELEKMEEKKEREEARQQIRESLQKKLASADADASAAASAASAAPTGTAVYAAAAAAARAVAAKEEDEEDVNDDDDDEEAKPKNQEEMKEMEMEMEEEEQKKEEAKISSMQSTLRESQNSSMQDKLREDDEKLRAEKEERSSWRQPEREVTSSWQPNASKPASDNVNKKDEKTETNQAKAGLKGTPPALAATLPGAVHVGPGQNSSEATKPSHPSLRVDSPDDEKVNCIRTENPSSTDHVDTTSRATTSPRTTIMNNNQISMGSSLAMPELADGLMPMPMPQPTARAPEPSLPGAHRRFGTGSAIPTEHIQPLYKGGMNVLGRVASAADASNREDDDDYDFDRPSPNNNTNNVRSQELQEEPVQPDAVQPPLINADVEAVPEKPKDDPDAASKFPSPLHYKLAAFVFAVVVVVIAIVAGVVASTGSSDNQQPIAESPTAAPTNPLPPLETVFPNPQDLQLLPLSTREAIQAQDTKLPQVQAYQWLVQDNNINKYEASQLHQRLALATLFFSTDGPNWFDDNNEGTNNTWLDYNTHECSWFSLASSRDLSACNNFTPPQHPWSLHVDYHSLVLTGDAKAANRTGQVNPVLRGTLVPELAMLTSLEVIDVSMQRLNGPIPEELAQLSSALKYIRLNDCSFTGTIPDLLYEFPQQLWLGNNPKLDAGTIPTMLGMNTHLTHLILGDTNRNGTIPSQIGLLSSSLLVLDAQVNRMTGQMPSEFGQLAQLQYLLLSQNLLTGGLPIGLTMVSNLQRLEAFNNNQMQWQLLPEFFRTNTGKATWPNLASFNVATTRLQGTIPSEIGLLESLREFIVPRNKLGGQLPSELGQLPALTVVDVSDNEPGITGPVPQELCGRPELLQGAPAC